MKTARNVGIIALVAAAFAFIPGGGNAAQAIVAGLTLIFLATIGFGGFQLYRQYRMTLTTLPDGERAVLFGALGFLMLMVVGADEMLGGGGGDAFLWVIVVACSVVAIAGVWSRAQRMA